MKKEAFLEWAVAWAVKRATISLKAISEEYENPQIFTSKTTQEGFQAIYPMLLMEELNIIQM